MLCLLLWLCCCWLPVLVVLGQVGNLHVTEVEVVPEPSSFATNTNHEVVLEHQHHHPGVVLEQQQSSSSSASSSSLISGQKKQVLPSFSKNGGVVFFLHIPKTGGTSIRKNLEPVDRVHPIIFGRNYSTYWDTAPLVEDAIRHGNNNNTVLFYEIHATDAPSFYKLRKRLRRWKETAAHNNVPVFFFTVLREPISYAFSHFNYFHVQPRNPTFEQCNATEDDFLRKSLSNPQCQFLFKGESSMRLQQAKQIGTIQPEECEDVHGWMMDLFDWIGTTERLSNETLPLLARLFELPSNFTFQKYRVAKDFNATMGEYFGIQNVTASALDSIRAMSTLDTRLYERAKQNFPYSMWE